ncbi:MAG: hypothetical protein H6Q10_6 [Acidobacteria bacterium]|nr:hypothetical protein [Acidobacteriota bacterium]
MSDETPRVDLLSGWMEAERAGRLDEAEAAFAVIFAGHVSPLAPPPSFADAVVARAVAPWRPSPVRLGLPVRALIASAVVLMGLPLALFTGVSLFDLLAGPGARLAPAVVQVVSAAGAALSVLSAAWDIAAAIGEAVLAACATGPAPLVLLLNVLLATAGYLGLRRLLAPQKECW